jgi:O-antigen ligase
MPTNSFAQAHNDYLDVVAAIGLPAGACLILAYALLLGAAWRRARGDPEIAGTAAILAAGAVAAFTWFPFQIVPAALWLLLQAGDAHRLLWKETA